MTNPAIEELETAAEEFERRADRCGAVDDPIASAAYDFAASHLRSRISQLEQEPCAVCDGKGFYTLMEEDGPGYLTIECDCQPKEEG